MMAWWQLARNNIQPGTFFIYVGELMTVCHGVLTPVITV